MGELNLLLGLYNHFKSIKCIRNIRLSEWIYLLLSFKYIVAYFQTPKISTNLINTGIDRKQSE